MPVVLLLQHPVKGMVRQSLNVSVSAAAKLTTFMGMSVLKIMDGVTGKDIADNKCADHMIKHSGKGKATKFTENVCRVEPRSHSEPAFPPAPAPEKIEKLRYGWRKHHSAAVAHTTRSVREPRWVTVARHIAMYKPAPSPRFGCPEPGSWFPRPVHLWHDNSTKSYSCEYWREAYRHHRACGFKLLAEDALLNLLKVELVNFWDMGTVNFN